MFRYSKGEGEILIMRLVDCLALCIKDSAELILGNRYKVVQGEGGFARGGNGTESEVSCEVPVVVR